ncbi:MAG: ABC transporter permease [Chitinophagales bacterium]
MGASVQSILVLLSRDFLFLVALSILIAVPVISWAMNNWLQSFAYRIGIGWWIYLVAGAFAILIAMATVGFHAVKASLANPVNSLRSE